ncbi:hypothetical protein ACIBSW_15410 [Actinoplanes sp. NPDC049668]|uniref:hypothetical protein n=1 Tax=unclassified Actinoplanes TaxID=2626549 RepID=UPI0033B4F2CE
MPVLQQVLTKSRRKWLYIGLAFVVGCSVGFVTAQLMRDTNSATAESLTGTVTWSNQNDRLIAFEADGEKRDPLDGQALYHVISDELNFPRCLTATASDPVRLDHRRVTLEAVNRDYGGPQQTHVAMSVRCLD